VVVINDIVYGVVEVSDLVLIELMASAPLQRLKLIDQHGARPMVLPGARVNRYDHCVGVMLLLRKLGASLEEQVAGLLHDVPHTAFSHVIDYVFTDDNNEHSFHENHFEKVVMNSEIPEILEKYDIDVKRVINESLFGLLERSLPDLCADRLDYSMRDYLAFGKNNSGGDGRCARFISHLRAYKGEIVFDDLAVALEYANHYLWMDRDVWSTWLSVAAYQFLGEAIKRALEINVLTFDDLFLTDDVVMSKLRESNDAVISENLSYLVPTLKVESCLKENADISSMAKLRYVDPKVLVDGSVILVSEKHPELLEKVELRRKVISNGVFLKVVSK
jgi:uncharacterized protein